ncbi:hypothetical protein OQJ15_05465 [Fluoribacter dumoffii]|uniref:Uncharacterized protein n=1 Tax=Fluoribacter dumoffii TaxID=463 RepID=A0A377GAR2_9GAMM|nr:hypothetical protein [Fluoribacter dumoffii]KTC89036.1 hypothetical protein Ldum_3294 [Fluoribacter dumoffii NY 23]MCW8385756.1 hypothetical protein [Fluoribacter dumoffii]MCW8495949.1 hypothetical protein [Fluoribacter dumoffii]STO21560.1 Uncharacterised protein [Fluoribacter dumoffii]
MTVAQKLEKASGIFFFTGFLLSKLQYIPFPLAAAAFRFISLGVYLLAYLSWLTASVLHPDHREHHLKWYGFAQIKEQFMLSSFIGFTATIISVAAVFLPALLPPAAWLFLLGNIIWTIGEIHKLKNPPQPHDKSSYSRQEAYVSYAITSSVMTLVTAASATLIFLFPPAAIPITIFSLIICTGMGALAFEFWLKSTFSDLTQDEINDSYAQMGDSLGPSDSLELTEAPEPGYWKSLNWRSEKTKNHLSPESSDLLEEQEYQDSQREFGSCCNTPL